MRAQGAALLLCCSILARAQIFRFVEHRIQELEDEAVTGYALDGRTLVTWGTRLLSRTLPHGKMHVLRQSSGHTFSEAGGLMDVDGDGQLDLVVGEAGSRPALVWFRAPRWSRHEIDPGVDAGDILPATLHGRRGVLLVHRRNQVRFYQIPPDPLKRWRSRDIYSFYSPSAQGGLLLADIDLDGLPDILCGNYWIQSPKSFELPWRLFAIDTWSETEESAVLRLVFTGLFGASAPSLVATQRRMPRARLAWFDRPADPTQLWTEHPVNPSLDLSEPHSLDVADFDSDGYPDILVGERAGSGRLILFHNDKTHFSPQIISQGPAVYHARTVQMNGDGKPDILVIRRNAVNWWENRSQ